MIDWRDEAGVSGTIEMLIGVGLLLFPMVMLVAAIPTWIEAKSMGVVAAQEAARTMVLAPDAGTGAEDGRAAAEQIALNHGFDPGSISVRFEGALDWGEVVVAYVTVPVPVLVIPGLGTFTAADFTASHSERVDDYRSFPP